ncbi:deoxycytidine deaminase [Amycolatopsis acidicola]|uniref:Deoxycytidine deaminase n=1 Tax=Amycolatopsis acidicola TaxID=2596893 RepID=A0A5N0ULE8_9PSEU|nr:deoxycytidine deaminase [Amycolatopsis acidicola]KAA9150341.1 deoxycytidine deaminase [Amycolatopsis acidicola]
MILTGPEIAESVRRGEIVIEPFCPEQLNPNSYNYLLGREIQVAEAETLDARRPVSWREQEIPDEGFVLSPGRVYLANTAEVIGSRSRVTTLIGRSSLGRLGLFTQVTADLGHHGAIHRWTLELTVVQPLRVYAGMRLGQVSFWRSSGDVTGYDGPYGLAMAPMPFEPASLV